VAGGVQSAAAGLLVQVAGGVEGSPSRRASTRAELRVLCFPRGEVNNGQKDARGGVVIAHLRMTRWADEGHIVWVVGIGNGQDMVDVESADGADEHGCPQHLEGVVFEDRIVRLPGDHGP